MPIITKTAVDATIHAQESTMAAIGEKQAEISGKITSVTIRDTDTEVNVEANVDSFGMVFGTVTFAPAVDAARETGPGIVRGRALRPDGATVPFKGAGTWRKTGHHQWEIKHISLDAEGQRVGFGRRAEQCGGHGKIGALNIFEIQPKAVFIGHGLIHPLGVARRLPGMVDGFCNPPHQTALLRNGQKIS